MSMKYDIMIVKDSVNLHEYTYIHTYVTTGEQSKKIDAIYGKSIRKFTHTGMFYKCLSFFKIYHSQMYTLVVDDVMVAFGCVINKIIPHLLKKEIWIAGIYVMEEFRHQRYGTKLMKTLLNESAKLNKEEVYLYVAKNNINALNLYDKLGFVKVGVHKDYWKMCYEFKINQ